jgi:hypothetical protein
MYFSRHGYNLYYPIYLIYVGKKITKVPLSNNPSYTESPTNASSMSNSSSDNTSVMSNSSCSPSSAPCILNDFLDLVRLDKGAFTSGLLIAGIVYLGNNL